MGQSGKTIILCCTMDTKSCEALYLKEQVEAFGHEVRIIDMGMKKPSPPVYSSRRPRWRGSITNKLSAAISAAKLPPI